MVATKLGPLVALLLLAAPSFAFVDTLPKAPAPSFPGKINNTVARTVDGRLARSGIPITDPRRGATLKALSQEATALTKARGLAAGIGRRIPWASLLMGVALANDPQGTVIFGETPPGQADLAWSPAAEIAAGRGSSVPLPTQFPSLYPVDYGSTERRHRVTVPTTYGGGVCWGSTLGAASACVLTRMKATLAPQPVSFMGAAMTSGNNFTMYFVRNAYRRSDGVLVNAQSVTVAGGLATGYWAPEAIGCVNGVQWQAGCIATVQSDPVSLSEYDYPEVLPSDYFDRPLSPAQLAALVNKLWADAAVKTGYAGIPWSASDPVTAEELQAQRSALPGEWPTVNDAYATPSEVATWPNVSTVPFPANQTSGSTNPGYVPEPGVDVSVTPGTGTGGGPVNVQVDVDVDAQVDLGPDPGAVAPDLVPPLAADIIAPAFGWFDLDDISLGVGTCPAPEFDAFNEHFVMDAHCDIIDQWRPVISAIMIAVWSLAALGIILRA